MPQQQSVSVKAYDQKEETQKNIETPAKEEKV